jgi:hypothetical protein
MLFAFYNISFWYFFTTLIWCLITGKFTILFHSFQLFSTLLFYKFLPNITQQITNYFTFFVLLRYTQIYHFFYRFLPFYLTGNISFFTIFYQATYLSNNTNFTHEIYTTFTRFICTNFWCCSCSCVTNEDWKKFH